MYILYFLVYYHYIDEFVKNIESLLNRIHFYKHASKYNKIHLLILY